MSDDVTAARSALVVLRRRVDEHFAAARAREPDAFACRLGCASCCRPGRSVFALEAESIARALAVLETSEPTLRARIGAQADDPNHPSCALLVDGRCAVYEQRPLVCRSHGLAIAREENGASVVEHCELNYVGGAAAPASVLRAIAVIAPLSVAARMFDARDERIDLAALARRALISPC